MSQEWREQIAETAVLNLGQVFQGGELEELRSMFDADRANHRYFWHAYGHHQQANYDALITSPRFDELIRHPRILPAIEELMGGPVCFGEIGLRYMGPYDASYTGSGTATSRTGRSIRCGWTTCNSWSI